MENSVLLCNCFAGVQAIQLRFDLLFCCPRRLVRWLGGPLPVGARPMESLTAWGSLAPIGAV